MSDVKKAAALFDDGFNCSQALLAAFAPALGLNANVALKLAAGLGEGMAMRGEACGAVTGALMVLGLAYGYTSPDDRPGKMRLYSLSNEFVRRFEERNDSILCRELMGFTGEMPKELQLAVKMNLHQSICPKFVRDAAELLNDMLYGEQKPPESWDAEHIGDDRPHGPIKT